MKKAIQFSIFILLVILTPMFVMSQASQADLVKDLVKVVNGKMIITDYELLKQSDGTSIQIKAHCEAPATGVISRDYFVQLFSILTYEAIDGMKSDDKSTTKTLAELIGNPDVEINAYMNKSGVQFEIKTSEGTNRKTMEWAELFQ